MIRDWLLSFEPDDRFTADEAAAVRQHQEIERSIRDDRPAPPPVPAEMLKRLIAKGYPVFRPCRPMIDPHL